MPTALVLGGGGLRGAYGAGAAAELSRQLGSDAFDAVYATSVGTFAATFLLAGQPDVIENTWKNKVGGRQLLSLLKILTRRKMLDLDYLLAIFRSGDSQLDIPALDSRMARLTCTLTRYPSGDPAYVRPTVNNIFDVMKASSALPFVHGPVRIGEEYYLDGSLVDPMPVERALEEGHQRVLAVINMPSGKTRHASQALCRLAKASLPPPIAELVATRGERYERIEKILKDRRITVLRPTAPLPVKNMFDTDPIRIRATVDQGITDTRKMLEGGTFL